MGKISEVAFRWQQHLWKNSRVVIILFGVFLLGFIWVGLYYKIQDERQVEIERAITETANFSRAFEEHTLRTIRGADQTVLFLKYQYEQEGKLISIPRYISEGRLANQPFVLLSVADEQGNLVVSSQVPFVSSNLKDREHFLVHKAEDSQNLFISKPVLGRSSGKWSIQMTRRINQRDGRFGGVVVVSVGLSYFTNFYQQVNLGEKSSITLVGLDGIIRARQAGEDNAVGQDIKDSPLLKAIINNGYGYAILNSSVDQVKRIYSYRVLPDYPLAVVVGIAEEEVFSNLNQRVTAYYQVLTVLTLAIFIFIFMLLVVIERQKRAEIALEKARDELELKVKRRTKELFDVNGELIGKNDELQVINAELQQAYSELKNAQSQVIHQEKMASIGQLAAGVAHEINNPLGFVISNFETLQQYMLRLVEVIAVYREIENRSKKEDSVSLKEMLVEASQLIKHKKIDYIVQDVEPAFAETIEGLNRVSDIVKALRIFSRGDKQGTWEPYDLNEGIKSSLVVSRNELKYTAELELDLEDLPFIQAVGGQINQVVLNLLLNAAQAIAMRENSSVEFGLIKIKTYLEGDFVYCSIGDNGVGMAEEIQKDIFNPFFTTKAVGSGTGLGLSISYDIIVNKHQGRISFASKVGVGTEFLIQLPVTQSI